MPADLNNLSTSFKNWLKKQNLSEISVRNYYSDVNKFLSFIAAFPLTKRQFNLEKFEAYRKKLIKEKVPQSTINRAMSGLRRFGQYMLDQKLSKTNPCENLKNVSSEEIITPAPNLSLIGQFGKYLEKEQLALATIKNYQSDVNQFFAWLSQYEQFIDLQGFPPELLKQFETYLRSDLQIVPTSISRKISSLKKFFSWAQANGLVSQSPFQPVGKKPLISSVLSKTQPAGYQPNIPRIDKKIIERLRNSYEEHRYLYIGIGTGIIILLLLLLFKPWTYISNRLSEISYQQVSPIPKKDTVSPSPSTQALLTTLSSSPWIINYKGKLTASSGKPIQDQVKVVFSIYDNDIETQSLWSSKEWDLYPDSRDDFQVPLGDTTRGDKEIPSQLFFVNNELFLGASIGGVELLPRTRISTASNAANAYLLDRHAPAEEASKGAIPVIDQNGALTLAAPSPKIKALNDTFAIEGQAVTISTPFASDGDITLQPDGSGVVKIFASNLQNSSLDIQNANLVDGSLISASLGSNITTPYLLKLQAGASPSAKFTVEASGKVNLTGILQGINELTLADSRTQALLSDKDNTTLPENAGSLYKAINLAYNKTTASASASSASLWTDGGDFIYPTASESARIYDKTGSDYIQLSHDGNAAEFSAVNTSSLGFNVETIFKKKVVLEGETTLSNQFKLYNLSGSPTTIGEGSLYYNTTDDDIYLSTGAGWIKVGSNYWTQSGTSTYLTATANNVGIGTATPGEKLDVAGGDIRTDADLHGGDLYLGYDDASALLSTTDTNEDLTINPNGAGDIYFHGSTYQLSDTGDLTIGGRITFENSAYIQNETDGILYFNEPTIQLSGSTALDFDTATLDIDATLEIQLDGALTDIGSGAYSLADGDNDLGVAGDFEVVGTSRFGSTDYLTIETDGDLAFTDADGGASITGPLGGALAISAGASQNLDLNDVGTITFETNGETLTNSTDGYITANAGFSVGGGTTYYFDTLGNLNANAGTFAATLTANGNIDLGDATSDTVTFTARVDSNVEPDTGSARDLGSSARRWSTIYGDTGNFTTLSASSTDISGTNSNDFLINADNTTADTESATLSFERGTPAVNSQLAWNASGSHAKTFSFNAPLFINPDSGIAYSGTAALIINQIQNQPVLTASASGTTVANLDRSGNFAIEGALSDLSGTTLSVNDTLDVINGHITLDDGYAFGDDTYPANNGYIPKIVSTYHSALQSASSIYLNIDDDNNATTDVFVVSHNNINTSGTELFRIQEDGSVGIGITNPSTQLHIAGDLTITGDDLFMNTNTSGYLLVADGTNYNPVAMSGDVNIDSAGATTIQANAVALGTDTTGNYVGDVSGGSGISVSGTPGEGYTETVALGSLTADWSQTGAYDIALANAGSELKIMESVGATYYGIFDVTDLGADRTYTFPNQSGTVAMTSDISTYSAGNDLDLSGTTFNIESQLDYVSTISRASSNLTLQTTTSGDIILSPAGYVGIGTTAPASLLSLNTTAINGVGALRVTRPTTSSEAYLRIDTNNNNSDSWLIGYNDDSTADLVFERNFDGGSVVFTSTGRVGIGTTGPGYTLTVSGTAWVTSGAWSGSDIRWKQNIQPIDNALSKVLQLSGVAYNWRKDEFPENKFDDKTHLGLIAQDVEKIIPQLVTTGPDGYKGLDYNGFSALLINAIQEQQTQIESLNNVFLTQTGDLRIVGGAYNGILDPSQASQTNLISQISPITLISQTGKAINRIGAFSEIISAKIKAGLVDTTNLIAQNLAAGRAAFQSITANDARISKLIADNIQSDKLISPVIDAQQINLNGQDLSERLENLENMRNNSGAAVSELLHDIENDAAISGKLTAQSITANNASVSELVSTNIQTDTATISGELYAKSSRFEKLRAAEITADKIKADTIEGLDAKIANILSSTMSAKTINTYAYEEAMPAASSQQPAASEEKAEEIAQWEKELNSLLAKFNAVDIASASGSWMADDSAGNLPAGRQGWKLETGNLEADMATFNTYLAVLGTAAINNLEVGSNMTVAGNLQFTSNSISTLGCVAQDSPGIAIPGLSCDNTLYLQPSGKGKIDFLAGALSINETGDIFVSGNIYIAGKTVTKDLEVSQTATVSGSLFADLLRPINRDLTIRLASQPNYASSAGKLRIENTNNSLVASIDASGSATFNKLTIAGAYDATPSGSGFNQLFESRVKSSATAGTAKLPAKTTELVIENPHLTEKSLVYVTPTSDTQNQVLYVKNKSISHPPSAISFFVVAVNKPISQDINFNWWIIN